MAKRRLLNAGWRLYLGRWLRLELMPYAALALPIADEENASNNRGSATGETMD